MPPPQAPLIPTAKPKHSAFFDSFNSSSTGNQRGENKTGSSTGWRLSRIAKLAVQFRGGATSKQSDSSQRRKLGSSTALNDKTNSLPSNSASQQLHCGEDGEGKISLPSSQLPLNTTRASSQRHSPKGIFDGLVIYINGSTYPLISDHRLKHLLAENGAKVSIHLGRKQVTHVIIGTPSNSKSSLGAGGGLAAGKMQKEIGRVGGQGIRYVGVAWALESIKMGKRLPEARFGNLRLGGSGQKSVRGDFFGVRPEGDAMLEGDAKMSGG